MLSTICNVSSSFSFPGVCSGLWANYILDDVDLVHGMPVCVQIVGGRFGEEKAVAVGKVVDELMNQRSCP